MHIRFHYASNVKTMIPRNYFIILNLHKNSFFLILCIFLGFIISFGMRCNMGMAKLIIRNNTQENNTHSENNNSFKFNWTIGVESALDSSFFWGYLVTQVPGGFLASLYPANRIFGAAIAISSFLNLLVPGALKVHPIVDMCVQVLKGLVEVRIVLQLKGNNS